MNNAMQESKTKNWTPEWWKKRYERIGMTSKGVGLPAVIILLIFAIFTKHQELILPFSILAAVAVAIPWGYKMSLVYRTSDILDVDMDPERYKAVLQEVESHVHCLLTGWTHTEQARAEIALGNTEGAKAILMSDIMKHGMNQFYVTRRLELLGICAIMEQDRKTFAEYEKELVQLKSAKQKCGCGDNTTQNIAKVEKNWEYLKPKFMPELSAE